MFLIRSAILCLVLVKIAPVFSQSLQFTKEYEALKSHVPLKIINTNADYFYLLRYNKKIHDFLLERRNKNTGRILSFTPLELDSVNANWFDYESLDYLCFASGNKLCLAFERKLNNSSKVFVKLVDTAGRHSRFIEVASLEKGSGVADVRFIMQRTEDNNLLIIGEELMSNRFTKKTAILFSPQTAKITWFKKLPPENVFTGYSMQYACNKRGDLAYTLHYTKPLGSKRIYADNSQQNVTVVGHDSLFLMIIPHETKTITRKKLALPDSSLLKNFALLINDSLICSCLMYSLAREGRTGGISFITETYSIDNAKNLSGSLIPMDSALSAQLTFFDGSDFDSPGDKDYEGLQVLKEKNRAWLLAGREEKNFSKELLLYSVDASTGGLLSQNILPRKIFYFEKRTRFRQVGRVMADTRGGILHVFILEARQNTGVKPEGFNYHRFEKQKYQWGANLVDYKLEPGLGLTKKVVFTNSGYELIPLSYEGNGQEMIFYLTNGRKEKFATLKLEGL